MATAPASAATALDRSDESATAALYNAAIGPVNTGYYLPIFNRFETADRAGISWNWAASLCTLNWFAFRQLWSAALLYTGVLVGLVLLVFGIGRLVFQFSQFTELGLLAALGTAAFVLPGLFGNAVFHAQCRKRMASALAANTTLPEACVMLKRQASSRQRLIWLMLANMSVLALAAAAYVLFPEPGTWPGVAVKPPEARNLAVGRATDAAPNPAAAASLPVKAASAPLTAASAPVGAVSAPVRPAAAASAPAVAASSPAQAASAPETSRTPAASTAASGAGGGRGVQGRIQMEAVAPAASAPQAAATAPTAAASAANAKATATVSPARTPTPAASAPKAAAAAPQKPSSKTPSAPRFFINVGLFAQEANARNAHTRLLDAGLNAFTQELKTSKGTLIRVRVGPFETQAQADAAVERIRALGLDAIAFEQ